MDNIKVLNINEKIDIAKRTTSHEVLTFLSEDLSINVRTEVAKNLSTPVEVINKLAYDAVLNVSYTANKHFRCTVKREFSSSPSNNSCVVCDVLEIEKLTYCSNCQRKHYA